jgi:hypothetical protein
MFQVSLVPFAKNLFSSQNKNINKQLKHKTLLETQKQFSPLCHIRTLFQTKNKIQLPKHINKQSPFLPL